MLDCDLHASVFRFLPVTELAEAEKQNKRLYIRIYAMSASKSTELRTFSKANLFPLYTKLYT